MNNRQPELTLAETDAIRNFYAFKADIKLDNSRYPNRAIQKFYSRRALSKSVESITASLIISKEKWSEALEIVEYIYNRASTQKFEVILCGLKDCILANTFGPYQSRLRIRAAPQFQNVPAFMSMALAALHASSDCIKFVSTVEDIDFEHISRASSKIIKGECQVLVSECHWTDKVNWEKIARQTVFSSQALAPLGQVNSLEEVDHLLKSICRQIEPGFVGF
jgi:hypothetical protein